MNMIYLMEYLPLVFMGFLCGFVRFARNENEIINEQENEQNSTKLKKTRFLRVIDIVLTSAISSIIIFAILGYFTELNYLVKVGIAAALALYGVDKMLDIVHKIWDLKKGAK